MWQIGKKGKICQMGHKDGSDESDESDELDGAERSDMTDGSGYCCWLVVCLG